MGIFANILSKIFPSDHPAVTSAQASPAAAPTATAAVTAASPVPAAATPAPMPPLDVEQVLSGMAAKNPEKLNWKTSIVDLMKLLDMDSSLAARKQLATELHYSGDMNDSAAMNIWLQQQVMGKLAANGGKVPAGL